MPLVLQLVCVMFTEGSSEMVSGCFEDVKERKLGENVQITEELD